MAYSSFREDTSMTHSLHHANTNARISLRAGSKIWSRRCLALLLPVLILMASLQPTAAKRTACTASEARYAARLAKHSETFAKIAEILKLPDDEYDTVETQDRLHTLNLAWFKEYNSKQKLSSIVGLGAEGVSCKL
jgi:hypothetical protein